MRRTVALPAAQMSPCVGAMCKVNVSPAISAEEKCLSSSLLKSEIKGEKAQQKSLLVEPTSGERGQVAAQVKASGGMAGLGEVSAPCWPFIHLLPNMIPTGLVFLFTNASTSIYKRRN